MNSKKIAFIIILLANACIIAFFWCILPFCTDDGLFSIQINYINSVEPKNLTIKIKPIILLWTPWFNDKWPLRYGNMKCGHVQCHLTDNHSQYWDSDAVIFHGASSKITNRRYYPSRYHRGTYQLWVYNSMENPFVTDSESRRLSSFHNNLFHVMMTYSQDADIISCYGRAYQGRHKNYDPHRNYAKGKTKLIAWIASACYPGRTNFVRQLNKYIPIDMFGKCGNKICKRDSSCGKQLARDYKFYLSFENFICKDYITEKFYRNAIDNNLIPIVVGGGQYNNSNIVPPHSYIDVMDFSTIQDLANFIIKVNNSDTLYNSYFKWKLSYSIQSHCPIEESFCDLCQKLHVKEWIIHKSQNAISNLTRRWGNNKDNCLDYPQIFDRKSTRITSHSFKYHKPTDG